jgi:hypothetical protein
VQDAVEMSEPKTSETYDTDTYEPIAMMPAKPGDMAVYRDDDGPDMLYKRQLLLWAICRVTTTTRRHDSNREVVRETEVRIIGFTSGDWIDTPENASNFLGYIDSSWTEAEVKNGFGRSETNAARQPKGSS